MRRYETIFILDPDLAEEERKSAIDRITTLLEEHDGFLVKLDEWGSRKLAYEVKKKKRGYYVLMDYCAEAAFVAEMERILRIDDRYIRYLTVLLDPELNLDQLKKELEEEAIRQEEARKKAEEEKARQAAAAAVAQEEAAKRAEVARAKEKEEAEKKAQEDAAKKAESEKDSSSFFVEEGEEQADTNTEDTAKEE